MPKFQEWEYMHPDNADLLVHIRMKGRTMCGLSDDRAVELDGPFHIYKKIHDGRTICDVCEEKFKPWLAARYPMLEGWV